MKETNYLGVKINEQGTKITFQNKNYYVHHKNLLPQSGIYYQMFEDMEQSVSLTVEWDVEEMERNGFYKIHRITSTCGDHFFGLKPYDWTNRRETWRKYQSHGLKFYVGDETYIKLTNSDILTQVRYRAKTHELEAFFPDEREFWALFPGEEIVYWERKDRAIKFIIHDIAEEIIKNRRRVKIWDEYQPGWPEEID